MRRILNLFKQPKKDTASVAKERLQIIISSERIQRQRESFLPEFKQDLLNVIAKYFALSKEEIEKQVRLDVEQENGQAVLELNITLPENVKSEELVGA